MSNRVEREANYWVFTLDAFCDVLFCAVDATFGNNISQDVIVVLGSFWMLYYVLRTIARIGTYAYQAWRHHPYNCLLLSIITAAVLGIVLMFVRVPISHLFQLTDTQYKMLQDCLLLGAVTLPMEIAARFMLSYITYNCYNKLMVASNILTYVLLIVTDILVVKLKWGCIGLLGSTQFTWLVYLIVVVIGCKFWKVKDKIRLGHLKHCANCSYHLLIFRILRQVANLGYSHFASTLGSDYVIHTLCYNIVDITETFRQGLFNYQMVLIKAAKDKFECYTRTLKHYYAISVILLISAPIIALLCTHGKVTIAESMPYLFIYILPSLVYPVYDSLYALFTAIGRTKTLISHGVISCICRIPLAAIFMELGFGLPGIASIISLDYFISTLYFLKRYRDFKKQLVPSAI